jgi:hypothetical protein
VCSRHSRRKNAKSTGRDRRQLQGSHSFVQPLPSKMAILSSPMHAIDATKHTWKSSRCIL